MQKKQDIPYFQEILRKSIHLLSLSIPITYVFVSRETALVILIPCALLALGLDIGRHYIPALKKIIATYFAPMMRSHELNTDRILLNGASYVLLSACICVLIFPKIVTITAFTILIISDIASALIGRKFGKRPFLDKTLVGTAAFAVSALGVVAVIGWILNAPLSYYFAGGLGAIVGAVVESASIRLKMDDNLSIPLSAGFIMWGAIAMEKPVIADTIYGLVV